MSFLSRRKFLVTAGATTLGTLLTRGCGNAETPTPSATETPAPAANINPADGPETPKAKLGFIALTDAAPLVIAKEKKFFDKYGMAEVEVTKQASWAVTRDNLVLGSDGGGIDGAHILTPMPYLISEGIVTDGKKVPMYILARLNLNGQGICLSNAFKGKNVTLDSASLKGALKKVAMTFPGGTHDMWMRYWLAAGGIEPAKDVDVIVVPPPQMVANVKAGAMDAFCVGEPWPLQTVNQDVGYTALTTGELWKDHPEKAFAMRADWVDKHPKATKALLMAVQEAQKWCDDPNNYEEMCQIVGRDEWFKVPVADILDRTKGNFDMGNGRKLENSDLRQTYWNRNASYPFKSHDLWFLTENIRWGYYPADIDTKKLVDAVNREDLWREAAKAWGQEAAIPASTSRGVETFFDGVKFDPENPKAYLDSLKLKSLKA